MLIDISNMSEDEATAYVISLMCFPEIDSTTFRSFFCTYTSNAFEKAKDAHNGDVSSDQFHEEMKNTITDFINRYGKFQTFIDIVLTGGGGDLGKEIYRRMSSGLNAGFVYKLAIERKINYSVAANVAINEIGLKDLHKDDIGFIPTTGNLRYNILPQYSSVAHLWVAAAVCFEMQGFKDNFELDIQNVPSFPDMKEWNLPEGLSRFLILAEGFRHLGSRSRVNRRGPSRPLWDLESTYEFAYPKMDSYFIK